MTNHHASFAHFSDDAVVARVADLARCERVATVDLIAALAELDARRLYLGAGCSSLFTYCTQVLHLSEHAAYGRIEAARRSQVSGPARNARRRRSHAHRGRAPQHKTRREVEEIVAVLRPLPDARPLVRKLPAPSPSKPSIEDRAAPAPRIPLEAPGGGSGEAAVRCRGESTRL